MAFDLQEQEQIAQFKAWWQSWGKYLTGLAVAGLVAFAGWQGWNRYQQHQAEAAAAIYAQVEAGALAGDTAKARSEADRLKQEYAGTAHAPRAALLAAKISVDKGEVDQAQAQLRWVAAQAKETDLRDAARLRLAAVQLDQKQFDAALTTLNAAESTGMAGLVAEMRGDVLVEKGDAKGAEQAYQQALSKLPKDAPNLQFVQIKLDALKKG
ncbi:tetratricopeptide repeat protein [Chitiniphilus purpureus]|uniref:Ancillary SecYEG translocon subunit n=1 Tax=Chitiniphilus purpureus TaxID=2981137 RepID=A0ABY6DJP2_9NEIS|nr:tetratricopeptide repeat protein [Chitiniphilus sp. CD1]UXY14252.1 tetratricopeptide repeat protein [Chitiniphilus sp. CD1]